MKVALIHDHLAQDGGAEKVLKVLAEMYPEATIYTLLYKQQNVDRYFSGRNIETSIIQRLPGGVKHYQWYMPFMPMAVEFFDLREYDLVISDPSAFAKGVITSTNTLHISYCHTPTRYLWDYAHQYINELPYNKYFKKVISLMLNFIRIWDLAAADRVDYYIANSKTVRRRIAKYYRRDSEVVYPPVEIQNFSVSPDIGDYFLIGGRLSPYKRVDIVIEAFKELGLNLKIFGDGADLNRLKKMAEGYPKIEFLGRISDEEKAALYQRAIAFINPQDEDFGITAVESMASGRPVIAYRQGGATETVLEGKTGVFFDEQKSTDIVEAVKKLQKISFDPNAIRAHSESFSRQNFIENMRKIIDREYAKFQQDL